MHRRWVTAIEIAASFAAAALFLYFCAHIRVSATDRMGQVSGMATIGLRLLAIAVPLVAALTLSARVRGGKAYETILRFVCAALAGIASAAFAAGVILALRGTPFGLGGTSGDVGTLCQWADSIKRGDHTYSSVYPPLQVHVLVWLSELTGLPSAHAMKWFQVLGVAAIGPLAYSAWRLLMRPAWALGITIVSMVPLIEPYRPYAGLVLAVMVPVLLKFLDVLRDVGTLSLQRVMQYAAIFGVALGLLCLLYSGWFQWSAPGFVAAALFLFPWRDWRRGSLFCGIAAFVFGLFVVRYVMGFSAGTGIKDSYVYADALMEPTYFAMWRGGTPGDTHWQPLGELGGIGVFTLILAVGLAIALGLGRRQTSVVGLVSILIGCWLFRFWHAHNMWETKLVQLWPRTSQEILCCMVVLCVIALYLVIQRADPTSAWRSPSMTVGAVTSLVFVAMSSSAATTDEYVARNDNRTTGGLAWAAHRLARKNPSVAPGAQIVTSSSLETAEFSARYLTDGDLETFYSSELGTSEDHEEWIELHWDDAKHFSYVALYPAADGFPIDFTIEVWDGKRWVSRRDVRWAAEPYEAMVVELFPGDMNGSDYTTKFRIKATRLRRATETNKYALRFSEIELRR